jgi:LmbE family N-acetylglucosaminyl deacetylase
MGYCTRDERDTISGVRKVETYNSFMSLGVPKENIIWASFPDCQLSYYRGRRPAPSNEPTLIAGFTGLQNSFTYFLRKIRPTQVFAATSNDLHPDHRIVNEELQISLFHAGGEIWPELGDPIGQVPHIHEYGVYCDFPEPPQLQVKTTDEYLEKKMAAIAEFKSQKQIGAIVDIVKKSGPEEYFRAVEFRLYQPRLYRNRFAQHEDMPILR